MGQPRVKYVSFGSTMGHAGQLKQTLAIAAPGYSGPVPMLSESVVSFTARHAWRFCIPSIVLISSISLIYESWGWKHTGSCTKHPSLTQKDYILSLNVHVTPGKNGSASSHDDLLRVCTAITLPSPTCSKLYLYNTHEHHLDSCKKIWPTVGLLIQ